MTITWLQVIKFPSQSEQDQIVQAFFTKAGFPYIIGVIDGTHVEILKPTCKLLN